MSRREYSGRSDSKLLVQLVGDIGLIGEFREQGNYNKLLALAQELSRIFGHPDLRMANWEAPLIGEQGLTSVEKVKIFTNEITAKNLSPFHLNVACLANNHIFDCQESGFDKTVHFLNRSGTLSLGAGTTVEEAQQPLNLRVRDVPFTILAYVDKSTCQGAMNEYRGFLNLLEPNRVISEVRRYKREDRIVFVNFHWGEEYLLNPSIEQRSLARAAVDAGASIVLGHHPHRMQGYEKWQDGHIFYSLGNFLFGDTGMKYCWPSFSRRTALVSCEIINKSVIHVKVDHLETCGHLIKLDNSDKTKRIQIRLNRMLSLSTRSYDKYYRIMKKYNDLIEWPIEIWRQNGWQIFFALRARHMCQYLRRVFSWNLNN